MIEIIFLCAVLWAVGTLVFVFCRALIDAFDPSKIARDEAAIRQQACEAEQSRIAQREWLAAENQRKLNQEELSALVARSPLTREEQTRKLALEKSLGVLPAWRLQEEGFSPYA
jgi:hypothetical protein